MLRGRGRPHATIFSAVSALVRCITYLLTRDRAKPGDTVLYDHDHTAFSARFVTVRLQETCSGVYHFSFGFGTYQADILRIEERPGPGDYIRAHNRIKLRLYCIIVGNSLALEG
jgi:hypothetical protein